MNLANFINAKNVINTESPISCGDSVFEKLCSEYSDILPCCDTIMLRDNRFRDRAKILWGKADCVDLFELKNELLKTKHFKFKTASWCMYPVLKKGDILKVRSAKIDDIRVGDIPIYRSQDKLYAHRVVDKKVIDGKQFIITRPDGSRNLDDNKNGERVSEENILGKIEEVTRGRKIFSTQRKKPTTWDKFLYKKTRMSLKLIALLKEILETILTKTQSLKLYEVLGKKFAVRMKPHLNFELAVPFSNERLNRLYNYIPLKDNKIIDFSRLKEDRIFHLMIKFNDTPIGCASFLNRPYSCQYKGFWISDIYIRLRYRKLGFDSILLEKTKEILKEAEIDNIELFLSDKSTLAKSKTCHFMDNTEELLLICAGKDLDEELKKKAVSLIKEGINWQRFTELAMREGVTILIYDTLRAITPDVRIPQCVFDRLKSGYLFIVSKVAIQHKELMELLKLFAEKDITVLPLKGTLLSKRLYGDIAAHGLSVDFDLLIEEKDKEQVQTLLEEMDYFFNPDNEIRQWQWQYTFLKTKATMIELHWDITMMGRGYERIIGLWKGTRRIEEENIGYYEFKEEELLLYLSAHLINSSNFRQLRYVCDINELLHKYKDTLDWNSIMEKAKRWKVSNSLYAALRLSKGLFNSNLPPEVLGKLKPNFLKLILIKIFINRKVFLRDCLRKRLINRFLSYIFFELIEARDFSEYLAIIKRVLFPPQEVLLNTKNDDSKVLFIRYIIRLFKGAFKVLGIKCFL